MSLILGRPFFSVSLRCFREVEFCKLNRPQISWHGQDLWYAFAEIWTRRFPSLNWPIITAFCIAITIYVAISLKTNNITQRKTLQKVLLKLNSYKLYVKYFHNIFKYVYLQRTLFSNHWWCSEISLTFNDVYQKWKIINQRQLVAN